MPRFRATIIRPTPVALARAGQLIGHGGLVAFPTETVYGLGADATSDRAVASIYAAKRRPRRNPLIVHVATAAAARRLARFDRRAEALARQFWPGPLTLVLPRRPGAPISRLASAGLRTIALRVPDNPVALALIRAADRPLAAPSANRSGAVSPTRARHVHLSLGSRVGLVLDGGPCRIGVESTVLDLSGVGIRLLRPGGVPLEAIEAVVGRVTLAMTSDDERPLAPGQLRSHYAPRRPVRPNAARPRPGEAYLAFGKVPAGKSAALLNLSPSANLAEAAANLFAMMHALDRAEFAAIAVAPIPQRGLGRAINDRLKRAAAPRRVS